MISRHLVYAISALLLVCGTATAESEWAKRINAVAPANVTITKVEETKGAVQLRGRANSNADVAALMRAINQAGLGEPQLQEVRRDGGESKFVLRVKARR